MKNSKFLSLLTAAALVVSSFSGLAMNGGVARAAFNPALATTPLNSRGIYPDNSLAAQESAAANAAAGAAQTGAANEIAYVIGGTSKGLTGKIVVRFSDMKWNAGAGAWQDTLNTKDRNWDNTTAVPNFESLFDTAVALTNVKGTGAVTFTKYKADYVPATTAGAADYWDVTYTYSINMSNFAILNPAAAALGDGVTFTFTPNAVAQAAVGFAEPAGLGFAFAAAATVILGVNVSESTYAVASIGINELKFREANGSIKESDSWNVIGDKNYLTSIATKNVSYGRLVNGYVATINNPGAITTDATLARAGAGAVWYAEAVSSDNNVVTAQAQNAQAVVSLAAYGTGTATVTLTLNNFVDQVRICQMTVTVTTGTAYIRLYDKATNRDLSYVTLNGNDASIDIGAERRGASYAADTDLKWVLVNSDLQRRTNTASNTEELAKRIVSPDFAQDGAKLTAVGNGVVFMYVYTEVGGVYKKYYDGSPLSGELNKKMDALAEMVYDNVPEVRRIPVYTTGVDAAVHTNYDGMEADLRVDNKSITITPWVNQQGVGVSTNAASATNAKIESSEDGSGKIVKITQNSDGTIKVEPVAAGTATVTVKASYTVNGISKTPETTVVVDVHDGSVTPEPEPEHKAGEPVAEDGVVGYLNDDLKTVTVTDATVVSKAITIPATIQGFEVVAIDPQAFKGTGAKTVYVVGSVDTIGKGAFKNSKVKKVYFTDPAALQTVGKNAFKKTDAKVVGLGASFSEAAAKALKSAGAKTVKNNGTVK